MRIKTVILIVYIIILAASCSKKSRSEEDLNKKPDIEIEQIKKSRGFAVINDNRIRFRSDKDLYSKTLRYLDSGEIVAIILKDDKRVKIDELEDYWYYIEFEGIKGWVFGYYLDVYATYENALSGSKKYAELKDQNSDDVIIEESVKNDLYYISNGRLVQNVTGKKDGYRVLKIEAGYLVSGYFFSNNPDQIYYIGKRSLKDFNGSLFLYNQKNETNRLIKKDIHAADINLDQNIIIAIGNAKESGGNYWMIYLIYLNEDYRTGEIARIRQEKTVNKKEGDYFSWTLEREYGSIAKLRLNEKVNFIYFKPPEENLPYLVSLLDGKYIQVNEEIENYYNIDSARYLKVGLKEDEPTGKAMYNIILKDRFSGLEKEIIASQLYPINMSMSISKNLLVLSMIDMNNVNEKYYNSSVYVISLTTNTLTALSGDGISYQPKWSNSALGFKNQ